MNKWIRGFSRLLQVTLLVFLIGLVVLSWVLCDKGYAFVSDYLVKFIGLTDTERLLTELFTPARFENFRLFIWVITIGGVLFSVRLWRFVPKFVQYIFEFFTALGSKAKELVNDWNSLKASQKTVFGIFLFALVFVRIYYLLSFPLTEDEAFSYVHFVDKGFLTTSAYYPGPNNHILYNQMAWGIHLFTDSAFWSMKIPTFITGILTSIVVFMMLIRHFNFTITMMVTTLFSFSLNITVYSVLGRGYMLMTFFMIMLLISLIHIIQEKDIRFYNGVFVLSASLGFLAVPAFLYPFLSIVVFAFNFGFLRRGINVRWIVIDTFWTLVIVSILYLPVIIMNGAGSIFDNDWVRSSMTYGEFFSTLPRYFADVSNWLWDVPRGGIYISLVVFGFSIYALMVRIKTSKWFWFYLIVTISIIPIVILSIQKVQPPVRIWTYFSFFQYLFLGIAIYGISKLIFKKEVWRDTVSVILCAVAVSWFAYRTEKDKNEVIRYYKEVDKVIQQLPQSSENVVYTNVSTLHVKCQLLGLKSVYTTTPPDDVVFYTEISLKKGDQVIMDKSIIGLPPGTRY